MQKHRNKLLLFTRCGILLLLVFLTGHPVMSQNIFTDKTSQKIWEAKDRSDVIYTKHILRKGSSSQKLLALKGLLSWHDPEFRKSLIRLAKKGNLEIKKAVFDAMGQSRDSFYLDCIEKSLQKKKDHGEKAAARVALGKCITATRIKLLLNLEPGRPGYSECIYRAMLKGVVHEQLAEKMVFMLQSDDPDNRKYAAWYLSRNNFPVSPENLSKILLVLNAVPTVPVDISYPLIVGLGRAKVSKADSVKIRSLLLQIFSNASKGGNGEQALLRIAVMKAVVNHKFVFDSGELGWDKKVDDAAEAPLQLAMSDMMVKNCSAFPHKPVINYAPAMIGLVKNRECSSGGLKPGITNTIFDKIWELQLMDNYFPNYPLIKNILIQAREPAIKTAAMEAMIRCRNAKGFPDNLADDFIETLSIMVKDADPGVLSVIANAILEKQFPLDSDYDPGHLRDLFSEAKNALSLPMDMEAFIDIEKVLAMFGKKTFVKPEAEWNHPIDWKYVAGIPSGQKIRVNTSKGEFVIQLNVNEAPGSVSAILQLVESGYYNGKFFHRMVPGFVIQGGCPRGDGYGGADFTLRSEFSSLKYDPGVVGLASSGPNTESCQWFATHCSTPHLDGRYTIIGRVVRGMDVIGKLGVGDVMIHVEKLSD